AAAAGRAGGRCSSARGLRSARGTTRPRAAPTALPVCRADAHSRRAPTPNQGATPGCRSGRSARWHARRHRCGPRLRSTLRARRPHRPRARAHPARRKPRVATGSRKRRTLRTPRRARCAKEKRRAAARPAAPSEVLPELRQQRLRLRLLLVVAFVQHFLQDLARALEIAHLLVRLGEIELG